MTTQTISSSDRVLRQEVLGSRRFSNYLWATVVSIGGIGFLLAGVSSYLDRNLLPFGDATELIFVPQGLAIALDIGGGYNEFNQETGFVKVFRWGFPGKNRQIELSCRTEDVQSIRVEIREGLNPRRSLYLRIKGRRDVPLTRVGQPMSLTELENQGAELARFLGVPLEGL